VNFIFNRKISEITIDYKMSERLKIKKVQTILKPGTKLMQIIRIDN